MTAYYNENDKFAAQWLRNLIAAGHIAPGDVDERSIEDVRPADLAGYTQCHFFAGIGVWSYALRQAGWPDDRRVWTGSCPCQPFSAAGKGRGMADERHLWPAWFHLIAACQPERIYGEQVASKDGLAWLDLVLADLEGTAHAIQATDLCAAGIGAPHIRQRLYWVADSTSERLNRGRPVRANTNSAAQSERPRIARVVAVGHDAGLEVIGEQPAWGERAAVERSSKAGELADDDAQRFKPTPGPKLHDVEHYVEPRCPIRGFWSAAEWIACRDGKARPVEPGTFPLAHGATARVGRLRGYGNAIVAPLAVEWIRATM